MAAMGEMFHVVPDELRGYSGLLERQAEHFLAIQEHAIVKGGTRPGSPGCCRRRCGVRELELFERVGLVELAAAGVEKVPVDLATA